MRSIAKTTTQISQDEKEIKMLINSLKNVLTDVPYDFMYDKSDDDLSDDDEHYD